MTPDLNDLMKQAQQMQEKMKQAQQDLAKAEVIRVEHIAEAISYRQQDKHRA